MFTYLLSLVLVLQMARVRLVNALSQLELLNATKCMWDSVFSSSALSPLRDKQFQEMWNQTRQSWENEAAACDDALLTEANMCPCNPELANMQETAQVLESMVTVAREARPIPPVRFSELFLQWTANAVLGPRGLAELLKMLDMSDLPYDVLSDATTLAAEQGRGDVLHYCLEFRPADCSLYSDALERAALRGNADCVRLLLESDTRGVLSAHLAEKVDSYDTPIMQAAVVAVKSQQATVLHVLVDYLTTHASSEVFSSALHTLLWHASLKNSVALLRSLVDWTQFHPQSDKVLTKIVSSFVLRFRSSTSIEVVDFWAAKKPRVIASTLIELVIERQVTQRDADLIQRYAETWSIEECGDLFINLMHVFSPPCLKLLRFVLGLSCAPQLLLREDVFEAAVRHGKMHGNLSIVRLCLEDPRCLPHRTIVDVLGRDKHNKTQTDLLKLLLSDPRVIPVASNAVFDAADVELKASHALIPSKVISRQRFEKACELPRAIAVRAARAQAKAARAGSVGKEHALRALQRVQAFVSMPEFRL